MRTTIDKAGRLVLPKSLRDQIGLVPGEVDVVVDGTGLRVEPLTGPGLVTQEGRLLVPRSEHALSDEAVQALRDADRR
jgi:AbrB family looped-hinge helix DNA binding protein